jgi:hypothetical protein
MRHRMVGGAPVRSVAVSICLATILVVAGFQMRGQVLHASNPLPSFEVATIKLTRLPQFDQQVFGCQREEGRVSTTRVRILGWRAA